MKKIAAGAASVAMLGTALTPMASFAAGNFFDNDSDLSSLLLLSQISGNNNLLGGMGLGGFGMGHGTSTGSNLMRLIILSRLFGGSGGIFDGDGGSSDLIELIILSRLFR